MIPYRLFFFLFVFLLYVFVSKEMRAESLIDEVYEGMSQKVNSVEARQEILKKAANEVSLKYVRQIIGEDKAFRYQSTIRSKILSQSDKYILLVKGRNLRKKEDGFQMTVGMKLSAKNLREALLSEGLLYQLDGPPKVIPMISFVDKVKGIQLSGWEEALENSSHLFAYLNLLEEEFKKQLSDRGFYFMSPLKYQLRSSLPQVLLLNYMKTGKGRDVVMFFGAAVVIQGSVTVEGADGHAGKKAGGQVRVNLQGIHASNGRVIGEVTRVYDVAPGSFYQMVNQTLSKLYEEVAIDLSTQLHGAWKEGTFGTTLVSLVLNGSLDYYQLNQFKSLLVQQLRPVKQIRERLFEPLKVTFELDSDVSSRELANHLKTKTFLRFKVDVVGVSGNQIDVNISGL